MVELDGHCYPAATCYTDGGSSGGTSSSSGECDQYGYMVKDACAAQCPAPTGDGGDFLWGMGRMIASTLEFIGEVGPGCWFQDCVTVQKDYDEFAKDHGADTGSDMYESGEVVAALPFFLRGIVGSFRGAGASASRPVTGGSLKHVNPYGGDLNCGPCAIATDRTLAGFPSSAVNYENVSWKFMERYFGSKFQNKPGGAGEIYDEVAAMGSGTRGIVFAWNEGSDIGHYFNVYNDGGHIKFLDGQAGGYADLDWDNFDLMITGG